MKQKRLKRNCPECDKELFYTDKSGYNVANKKDGTCKECGHKKTSAKLKKSNLSILLEETPITYYWIGFLLADGNFKDQNLIKCALASVDKDHLEMLQKYLNIKSLRTEKGGSCTVIKAMDHEIVPQICKKFDISTRKTYNPPNLSFIKNNDLKLALIAGFIDGDGCVTGKGKAYSLTIKCHSSWLKNLDDFAKTINENSSAKINGAGYASFSISNADSLKALKRKVIELKLPVLKRKWDKIDLDFIKNKEAQDRSFESFSRIFQKMKDKFQSIPFYKEKFDKLVYGK